MTQKPKDFARVGDSLRRVRVADRPLDGGGKKVWHQGEQGAEIISFVDETGHVTRQEVYVGKRVTVWRVDGPLGTGEVQQGLAESASDTIAMDENIRVPTVLQSLSLLEGYSGDDKYLEHLRVVLRIAAQSLPTHGLDPSAAAALRRVTHDQPVLTREELAQIRPSSRRAWLPWTIAAALIVLAGVLIALARTR